MWIPANAFKIAAELINQRLMQMAEPVDLPRQQGAQQRQGRSALSLLSGRNTQPTATEPAPKVVTDCGYQVQG